MEKTVTLNNGVLMPCIGLGLFKVTEGEVRSSVPTAVTSGYRLFDSAQCYKNETYLGNALQEVLQLQQLDRSDLFVTSKLDPRNQGFESSKVAVEHSLQNLRSDYIDLYLIHWPGTGKLGVQDPKNLENRLSSWKGLCEVYRNTNHLKAIGVSNFTPLHIRQLLESSDVRPMVLQSEFHPHLIQDDLRHFCKENKIVFQAYSSLGTSSSEKPLLSDPTISNVARKYGKSSAQVLLKFAIQNDVLIIPKATKTNHIVENTKLFDFELSSEDLETLETLNKDRHYAWDPTAVL